MYACIKVSAITFYAFLGHWEFKAFQFERSALALDFKGYGSRFFGTHCIRFNAFLGHWGVKTFKFEHTLLALDFK